MTSEPPVEDARRTVAVRLRSVSKTYSSPSGSVVGLADADLEVGRHECLALTGPSGSGKSTLLAVIAGLLEPDAGSEVTVCGVSWSSTTSARRGEHRRRSLGFVHQAINLVSFLDVEENVMLPLLLDGQHRAQARERARQGLARFGLADTGRRMPRELSGGQQQRVAVARALSARQPVLIADEPTGALDSTNSAEVFRSIADHAARGGVAIIASHDPLVEQYATRVVVLRDGHLGEER